MKIIFFGSSLFSIPVLEGLIRSHHKVVLVVTTPDRKQGRGQRMKPSLVKTFSEKEGRPVISPEKLNVPEVVEKMKSLNSDFLVIASYGKMVPSSIFNLPKIAPLNVHPSLLPKYRGASPIQSALLNGDAVTGVSIAEVTKDLDAGDLFGQVKAEILPDENAEELSKRLANMGSNLLLDVIEKFESGTISRALQDHARATFTTKLNKDLGRIDWQKPALYIHNQIRACNPWPSAFAFFRSKRLKVLRATCREQEAFAQEQGTILKIERNGTIQVQAGFGIVELIEVQLDGRRIMKASEFALGQRMKAGDRFEP